MKKTKKTKIIPKNKKFIVRSGNIKASIVFNKEELKNYESKNNDITMEAATRVFEVIFGNKEFKEFDILAIYDKNENNIFEMDEPPDKMPSEYVGILTEIYDEKDEKKEDDHYWVRSSMVFQNASLPLYVDLALKAEKEAWENDNSQK